MFFIKTFNLFEFLAFVTTIVSIQWNWLQDIALRTIQLSIISKYNIHVLIKLDFGNWFFLIAGSFLQQISGSLPDNKLSFFAI